MTPLELMTVIWTAWIGILIYAYERRIRHYRNRIERDEALIVRLKREVQGSHRTIDNVIGGYQRARKRIEVLEEQLEQALEPSLKIKSTHICRSKGCYWCSH